MPNDTCFQPTYEGLKLLAPPALAADQVVSSLPTRD